MTPLTCTGVPTTIAEEKTLVHAVLKAADCYGDLPAQVSKGTEGVYTLKTSFNRLVIQAKNVAGSLADAGLRPGRKIALWADNHEYWNLADLAAGMNGCASAGIYTNDSEDDIVFKINDVEARVVFTDNVERGDQLAAMKRAGKIPTVDTLVTFADDAPKGCVPFGQLLEPSRTDIDDRIAGLQPDDVAKVVYTSGTTGRPKGALVSHENLLQNAILFSRHLVAEPGTTLISYMPNAHIFQALMDYLAWFNGMALGYSGKKTIKDDLGKLRPHFLPGVPKVFEMFWAAMCGIQMGDAPKLMDAEFDPVTQGPIYRKALGLDQTTQFLTGGAKIEPELVKLYRAKLDVVIYEAYGISEVAGAATGSSPGQHKIGTCGRALDGVEIKAVDRDGVALPANEKGELTVRGPVVIRGYHRRPEATAAAFRDGWYSTGDRGTIDEDGYVTVLGRMGHLVKFANGEYYNLEAIGHSFLKLARLIGQVVVCGENQNFCVGLVALSEDLIAAQGVAEQLGIEFESPTDLVYHDAVIGKVREEFQSIREAQQDTSSFERIEKVIYMRPFTTANNECTATLKVRIRFLLDRFHDQLRDLYLSEDDFRVLRVDGQGKPLS